MARMLKPILIVTALSLTVSCGIFFTPMDDRWNTADPKNDLLKFSPSLDGYVEGTQWHDDAVLYAYPPPPSGSKAALLRFDTADFPRVVADAYLELSATSELSTGQVLYIYRITRDWDPSRITYDGDVKSGDLYDDSVVTTFSVPGYVSDIQIPLGDVFRGKRDDLANGIVIFSPDSLVFHSNESILTGTPPLLLVEPE